MHEATEIVFSVAFSHLSKETASWSKANLKNELEHEFLSLYLLFIVRSVLISSNVSVVFISS